MKTLITSLALAILISATQSVAAAPRDRRDAGQSGGRNAAQESRGVGHSAESLQLVLRDALAHEEFAVKGMIVL